MRSDAVRRSTRGRAGEAESSEAVAGPLSWRRTFPQGNAASGVPITSEWKHGVPECSALRLT